MHIHAYVLHVSSSTSTYYTYRHPRLPTTRVQYTKKVSGYDSTDEALKAVRSKSQCEWISVTNCDNVYGSDIIARVFRSNHEYSLKAASVVVGHGESGRKPLDMIIVPVDSRSFKGKFSGNKLIYHLPGSLESTRTLSSSPTITNSVVITTYQVLSSSSDDNYI